MNKQKTWFRIKLKFVNIKKYRDKIYNYKINIYLINISKIY